MLALNSVFKWFGRSESNFTEDDVDFVTPRRDDSELPFNRFASFLPYTAFDEESRLYVIEGDQPGKPEGWGFTLEIRPQIGASQAMSDFLVNVFSTSAPAGTGFQVQMYGSPNLEDFFGGMLNSTATPDHYEDPEKKEQAALLYRMCEQRIKYYRTGATSELFENFNYRMRNFVCSMSVVVPCDDLGNESRKREARSLRQQMITTLNQYSLFRKEWMPEDLINYLSLILNPHRTMQADYPWLEYDESRELRDQVISPDTRAVESEHEITYSGAMAPEMSIRAMSVRSYPKAFGLNHMSQLLGSATSTAIAYPCPFLITMGVTLPSFEAEKNKTMMKAARAQQTAESQMSKFLPHLAEVNEDWKIAQRAFDEGKGTCKVYHQLLLFTEPENLDRAEQSAKAVWRAERFELTGDRKMQKQGLLSSLPMMFGPLMQRDLKTAHRISTKTMFNAGNMMPIIGEWTGTPPREQEQYTRPVLNLFGRKGQAMGIDIFANPSGNYNGIVVGTSGSGKSFFLNELSQRTLANGGRVWILDVGRSYEKLCRILGGQYIEFTDDAKLSLNFFSLIEDIDKDMEMIKPVVAQMISPSRPLNDYELAQVEMHIRSVYYDHGPDASVTLLAESLKNNCSIGGPNPEGQDQEWQKKVQEMPFEQRQQFCDPRIRDLGVQLFPFTEDGAYGKYFIGPSNINFRSNFIVLELEELKSKKDLQAVVMLLLMYRITQDMYVSDRKQPKLVIIDEAWDLMGTGNSGDFIEAGYRRARKYGGSFFTATQSVEDYFKSETAKAAFNNADWMFLLRQKPESIEMLANSGKFIMDDHTKSLLRSVTTQSGAFSEVFVRGGDLPPAIGRLFADPFSLLTASSKAQDFEAVRNYQAQGMSTWKAVEAVLRDRGMSPA